MLLVKKFKVTEMEMIVNLKEHSYPIYIEKNILKHANEKIKEVFKGKKIMIISDDQVYPLYGDDLTLNLEKDFKVNHVVVPHGEKSKRFDPPASIEHLADKAKEVVSIGNQTGEGWFLTGEMIELIESGAPNIVCMQPFGCLPNHVTGKGAIKALRKKYPQSNIVAVDYDPGASEVNQLNRIKLMLSTAFKNLDK